MALVRANSAAAQARACLCERAPSTCCKIDAADVQTAMAFPVVATACNDALCVLAGRLFMRPALMLIELCPVAARIGSAVQTTRK